MKWSKYNYLFSSDKFGHLLYNSLSNHFFELPQNIFNDIEKRKGLDQISPELIDANLIKAKVFVESDLDEYYKIKLQRLLIRADQRYLSLTILPTRECNFNCSYCYEEERPALYMDQNVEDSLFEFIKGYESLKYFRVTWYGGEPLLAFDRIQSITSRILKLGIDYRASMITNGYLLETEIVNKLDDLCINSVQVTIDGMKDIHNKRRPHLKQQDSFQKIFKNLKYFFKKWDNKKVSLRVNIDQSNKDDFHILYNFLKKELPNDNLFIHPAYVTTVYSEKCNPLECELQRKAQSRFLINEHKQNNMKELNLYPALSFSECTARHVNSFVVGPQGELYKCWNDVGQKNKIVATLGNLEAANSGLMARYLTGADPLENKKCQECFFFPICSGGCAFSRLRNKYENTNINTCHIAKNNLKEFLELHYEKKMLQKI